MVATELESAGSANRASELRVLQLVTTPRSFFDQQVRVLEERGVACTVVEVPRPTGGRGPGSYLRFYKRVLEETAPRSYDLVHVNYGLLGPIGLAQPIRPVVLTLWGSELKGDVGWLERTSRFAARHSDAVVVPTEGLARELSTPHTLVPFGVDTELFRPMDRATARERLGWDGEETIVLFPYDSERPVKNYPLARRVVERLPMDVELRTVSGRPYEEMPIVMNACDALLVTSRYESGPMVVREAAACNLPVVSTDVGFVAEVLANVENSYVARSEDELTTRLARVLRSGARSNGRTTVSHLGLDEMGERLLGVYRSALHARR